MEGNDKDKVLHAMVEGLHAMIYGVYSIGSENYAREALGDGGSIHEYVHAMLLLLPARCMEQVESGGHPPPLLAHDPSPLQRIQNKMRR